MAVKQFDFSKVKPTKAPTKAKVIDHTEELARIIDPGAFLNIDCLDDMGASSRQILKERQPYQQKKARQIAKDALQYMRKNLID